MKKGVMVILACGAMFVSCKKESSNVEIPCVPESVAGDVIAFYPFSGGSLSDFSGYNEDLTNATTASPASDRDGNANCAYEFDNLPASSEFLTIESPVFLNDLDEFSVALWYMPRDTNRDGGAYELLVGRDVGFSCPSRSGQWSLGLYDLRQAVFGINNSVWEDDDFIGIPTNDVIAANTGIWQHVVATFKKDGYLTALYIDGVLQETNEGIAGCTITPDVNDTGNFFIGLDYTGRIDDIMVFNKSLNAVEVAQVYNIEPCCQ